MKRILYVTSAGDIQLADDIQRRGTEHLVLLVSQSLGRSDYDTVSGMNPHRVNIFHITYGNAVALAVTHHLIFDFLPACDAAFDQNLSDTGKSQSVRQDFFQFHHIVCDTAAASAEGVCRTKHDRISNLSRKCNTVFHIFHDKGRCYRFPDLLHGGLEFQTVFRLFDRLCCGTDQTDIMLF